jgi:sugar/nucleoside kinase (ribokinase family)
VNGVLATVGDLVDDIVVRLGGPVNVASDTDAVIERRQGGSAANVAVAAARITGSARFLGQVGDDLSGAALLDALASDGVEVSDVRRDGRTGAIVVLVDGRGERTFLTDPGASRSLADPKPGWLDAVDVLHVPLYSMVDGPIAATSATLIEWARSRSIAVSIDLSSVALIEAIGADVLRTRLELLAPDVLFANADEARALSIEGAIGTAVTYVKSGGAAATVHVPGVDPVRVPAVDLAEAPDTTGAGDAFAAGVLSHPGWISRPVDACRSGHAAAADLLRRRADAG